MPVKIVGPGGHTSVKDGTIKESDLELMTYSFIKEVSLTPIPPRNVVAKRYSFYFTRVQLLELLKKYKDNPKADVIEVAIGVQVPGSKVECDGGVIITDNSNCLGVVISMADKTNLKPFNSVNDQVLINGYQNNNLELADALCCPGSKPPPPYN